MDPLRKIVVHLDYVRNGAKVAECVTYVGNFKLIKTKNALTKAKKNKNNKATKYFVIKTHNKTFLNYNNNI